MSSVPEIFDFNPIYFKPVEFTRCSPPCKITDMNRDFLVTLDSLRHRCGFPLVLTSAFRSVEHEHKVGRLGTSSHTKGIAVDIKCTDSLKRMTIIRNALFLGIPRIGVHPRFIHLDIDKFKPSCIWLYEGYSYTGFSSDSSRQVRPVDSD